MSVINTHENRSIWQDSHGNEWLSESGHWLGLIIKRKLGGHIKFIKLFAFWVEDD